MSEHEKREQIGKLAEEYSELKGQLNHIEEKLTRAQQDYLSAGQQHVFPTLTVQNGVLIAPASIHTQNRIKTLEALLSTDQMIELLNEKARLTGEIKALTGRLRALAPHLL